MSKQAGNIHGAFFKKVLADTESAGTFLREHLPPDVVALLGPEPPEQLESSFVDEKLAQHHSDLLFRIHLQSGTVALAYVLMEHKSSPDPLARLQLLRYIVRILESWHQQNERLPLPPVLPLLVHQGPKGWNLSCEFVDLFGEIPPPLRQYLPSFRHALVDLERIDDAALSAQVRLRAFLKALKYALRPDLPARLDILLAEAPSLDVTDIVLILTYIENGPLAVSDDDIHRALHRLIPDREKQMMTRFGQEHFDKGVAKGLSDGLQQGLSDGLRQGLQRGRKAGLTEGEARALVRLLKKRFGRVPTSLRERISSADPSSLRTWFERAIDAPNLQLVFGPS